MATASGIRKHLAALAAASAATAAPIKTSAKKSATKPAKKAVAKKTAPKATPPVKAPAKRAAKKTTTAPTAAPTKGRAVMATDKYAAMGNAVAAGLRAADEAREKAEHDRIVAAVMAAVGAPAPAAPTATAPASPGAPAGVQHGVAPIKSVNDHAAFVTNDGQNVVVYKAGAFKALVAKSAFDADPDQHMTGPVGQAASKSGLWAQIKNNYKQS